MKKLLLILVALLLVGCTLRVESVPSETTTSSTTTTVAKTTTTTTTTQQTTTTQSDNFDDWTPEELAARVKDSDPAMFSGFTESELVSAAYDFCDIVDVLEGDMNLVIEGLYAAWSENPGSLTIEELGSAIAASAFIAGYGDLCPRWKANILDFMEGE